MEQGQNCSKLDKLKKFFEDDTLAKTLGIEICEASYECAICSVTVGDDFLNARGCVHGGTIYSLADYTFAVASNMGGKMCVTLDASVTYFKPASSRRLMAKAVLVSSTRHTCNYNISVSDDEDRLIATMIVNGYRTDKEINFD